MYEILNQSNNSEIFQNTPLIRSIPKNSFVASAKMLISTYKKIDSECTNNNNINYSDLSTLNTASVNPLVMSSLKNKTSKKSSNEEGEKIALPKPKMNSPSLHSGEFSIAYRSENVRRFSNFTECNTEKFEDFMRSHLIKKEEKDKISSTNTRIGDAESKIFGGSYHIKEDEYTHFLSLYYDQIFTKKKDEYLTEKQLEVKGPILIDIDLRFNYEVNERLYTEEHITDVIDSYLSILKSVYQFDEETHFNIYIFEKSQINRDSKKNITKDGIHIIIGIMCEHTTQQMIRIEMMDKIKEAWGDIPITNSWEDVLDRGISVGTTNWQLFGSKKPNYETYKLTKKFAVSYNIEEDECFRENIPMPSNISKEDFLKLSARYTDHPFYLYKDSFLQKREESIKSGLIDTGVGESERANRRMNHITNINAGLAMEQPNIGGEVTVQYIKMLKQLLTEVRSTDALELLLNEFLDNANITENVLVESYKYTMSLPSQYYTDYSKWIRVGWALRNISDKLFIVWIKFSSQSQDKFSYNEIPALYNDHWEKFDLNNPNGLTKRSIMHWSKVDANEKYNEIRKDCIDFYINKTIYVSKHSNADKPSKSCGEFDLAVVLYNLYKDQYICVSIKNNAWYMYKKHRWLEIDSGTTLRKSISNEMRDLYIAKLKDVSVKKSIEENSSERRDELIKIYDMQIVKIGDIIARLAKTNDKKNIMVEAKELFFDSTFLSKLDTNPYLLCFENGVVDFKTKQFRKGYPDDYLSKTTRINYIQIDAQIHQPIIDEINDFMQKLFPVKELHDYMWEHLASTLVGTSSNQTFNMYIGVGQNGKSVLISLMEMVLGEYKGDVPLSLVTDKRTKIGGLAPEMVALKGVRYAVMQEPSKGDQINEGVMKQITSGIDPIQARSPYMTQAITFIPQFKLVVCSNEFMEIKSQDHGTWRRIRVVDFMSLFVETPRQGDPEKPYQFLLDKSIKEKFVKWKEVFASMLVSKAFITDGIVNDCSIVMKSSNSYRENQDYIAEYFSERILTDYNGTITKSELTSDFKLWYLGAYGKNPPKPKDIQTFMNRKYGDYKLNNCWKGVKINYENKPIGQTTDDSFNAPPSHHRQLNNHSSHMLIYEDGNEEFKEEDVDLHDL
jgi:P4 family phage/plasmid primase-like protien